MKRILKTAALCLLLSALTACGSSSEDEVVIVEGGGTATPAATAKDALVSDDAADSAEDSAAKAEHGIKSSYIELMDDRYYLSKYDADKNYIYFDCHGNHMRCTPESAEAYPELAKKLDDIAEETEKAYEDEIKESEAEAREYADRMAEEGSAGCFSRYTNAYIKRSDDRAVSILSVKTGFLGGAHPDYYFEALNLDPKTGEEIKLSDVVTDRKKLDDALVKRLSEDYPEGNFFEELPKALEAYEMDEGSEEKAAYCFTLDPDGIAFYFGPYDLNSYADGSQVVKIPYAEEPDLFKKEYGISGGYITYLTDFFDNKYELGSDRKLKDVAVMQSDYDGYMYTSIQMVAGDEVLTLNDTDCFDLLPFLMHTESGDDYIGILTSGEDDSSTLRIVDAGGKLQQKGVYEYSFRSFNDEEREIISSLRPMDPENMSLAIRCDLLSTYNAYARFRMGDGGEPELCDEYYMIPDDATPLDAKQNLTADIVDEDGKVVEKDATIPKKQRYTLYRTDGEGIVDVMLTDGRIARLVITEDSDHEKVVNDQFKENELFWTLYYAG